MSDIVNERLARWSERDAVVGLDAELAQARALLARREVEATDLRSRIEQLANRVTQLELERNALQHRVVSLQRVGIGRRCYRLARSLVGRIVRR